MKLGIRYGLIRIELSYYLIYNVDLCDPLYVDMCMWQISYNII